LYDFVTETEDHPDVQMDMNSEQLESVYGSARFRKEVTMRKLKPEQIKLDELKLGEWMFCCVT
jgi:hypothetical protein